VAHAPSSEPESETKGLPWGIPRKEHAQCVESTGRFPLAADRSLTNVVLSTLSHLGSGRREEQGDRVSGREREQLGVSECSGTTVSGRSIHIHFTPLTRASRAHLLTLFSSPRGAESSCGWVRVIGLVHVAWAASSIRAAIARARCPWCWGGSTAVAQVSVAGVLSSGRRCVSTVSPRRWVECGVLDTGTNARFGELHGMALPLYARGANCSVEGMGGRVSGATATPVATEWSLRARCPEAGRATSCVEGDVCHLSRRAFAQCGGPVHQ